MVEYYKSNDSFDKVETNSTSFRHCRKDRISFDVVAKTANIVAKNGNNVVTTFDFVERTKFYNKPVRNYCRFLATKSNIASTLLQVWTGLNAHICAVLEQQLYCISFTLPICHCSSLFSHFEGYVY